MANPLQHAPQLALPAPNTAMHGFYSADEKPQPIRGLIAWSLSGLDIIATCNGFDSNWDSWETHYCNSVNDAYFWLHSKGITNIKNLIKE